MSSNKRRVTSLVYAGKCAGDKDFKAFYITKKTIDASHLLPKAANDELNLDNNSSNFQTLQPRTTERKKKSKSAMNGHSRMQSRMTLLSGGGQSSTHGGGSKHQIDTPTNMSKTGRISCSAFLESNRTANVMTDSTNQLQLQH